MKKRVDKLQMSAMIMGQKIANKIITNDELAEIFLTKIKNIPTNKKYSDIIKEILSSYPKINEISYKTLRTAAKIALNQLMTADEREIVTKKSRQRGGNLRIKDLHETNGTIPLSDEEKKILNEIGRQPEYYKKNTVRNIKRIQNRLEKEGYQKREKSTIYGYLKNFQTQIKEVISWKKYPEEEADLKKLYEKYHQLGKKLPLKQIVEELNAIHKHNRNENGVGKYIKDNFKDPQEKAAMTSETRPEEEQEFIRNIIRNEEIYTYPKHIRGGGYNLTKISNEFSIAFPNRKRGKKGIKHQIERQKKLIMEEVME